MTYRGIMGDAISVQLRSNDDFRTEVAGSILRSLQEITGTVSVRKLKEEPMDNPMALLVLMGVDDQFADIEAAALDWVSDERAPTESFERVVGIFAPTGHMLRWVWLEESLLGASELEAWKAEVGS